MEADLNRGLRLHPEAGMSAMIEGQWSTLLRPLTSRQRQQAPQSDPKVRLRAPEPGVSNMGVDQKRYSASLVLVTPCWSANYLKLSLVNLCQYAA